ncbi:glycosyltransferase family 25 protein [unidentified bacterial endosymbiont]|uniref:glycosyltransferase family 25 protein n=1 Tax=unidentified bacterial endosymbiont TaxID=2355 RepID=UPI00209D8382|nr:glycosyltransferase family 25 protein [unidentified bacterial endosymbiont]
MRIFIINLVNETERLSAVTSQCANYNLSYEVISAINGRKTPQNLLSVIVESHENSALTQGEIGCALSHLSVYATMDAENIPQALILEDDAVLSSSIKDYLAGAKEILSTKTPEMVLLTGNCSYNRSLKKTDSLNRQFHRVICGSGGHGYVINLAAARRLLHANRPVRLEADRWTVFRDLVGLKIWCSDLPVIKSCCTAPGTSTIGSERERVAKARGRAINRLKKKVSFYQLKRIKNMLLSKFDAASF